MSRENFRKKKKYFFEEKDKCDPDDLVFGLKIIFQKFLECKFATLCYSTGAHKIEEKRFLLALFPGAKYRLLTMYSLILTRRSVYSFHDV